MTVNWDELRKLQDQIGAANEAKGFHARGDKLRAGDDPDALREHYMMSIGLIVTEAAEGMEELRNGRRVNETYYPTWDDTFDGRNRVPFEKGKFKPEGVPSELADIVIRAFDFASGAGIDLAAMIEEKLAYNASRPFMHGGKKA